MSKHLRVHIVPVGYDSTRITEPLIERRVDRVHLLRHIGDKDNSIHFEFIKKELNEKMKELEIKEYFLNIWDLYECISKFREIILVENRDSNHVFVNVSTGSKITAIAGMLACMSWNASPYYAHVNYTSQTKSNLQKLTVKMLDDLPVYEINKPKLAHMEILRIITGHKGSIRKSKLIEELVAIGIIRPTERSESNFTIHAKFSQLHAILIPLEKDWKYIRTKNQGRRSEVEITEQGSSALKIFGSNV